MNGDGYSDVIIGSASYDDGEGNEGAVFAYYGSEDGLSESPNWMGESNQEYAYYGRSVSTAGDVNGDGFSDIIVGALYYDNGETDEGAAFVYYGSSAGLSTISGWMGEENQSEANYGIAVNTAGDVNGDGYSDVIVGAYGFDRGETNEGSAFLYYGSFEGLSKDAVWIGESNQLGAYYGRSVCSAGDVNGDGYGDVIVGSIYYDDKETNEGASFLYYGSQTGLSLNPEWIGEPNQNESFYGISVSTAGDVNGDGFSDVIIGAPYYDNMESDEGCIFLFLGNEGGLSQMIMQKNAESVPIIAPLYSNDYYLKINLNGKDYVGRGKVKLQWEVKDMDRPFDCKGLYESLEWYDTWLSGVNISENITGLTIGKYYKWRVRLIYEKSKGITQNNSRWFYIDDNSPTEADFKNQVYHSIYNHYEYDNHIETQLVVTINEIKYSVLKTANILIIYDITGLVVYKSLNNSKGTHSLSLKSLPTGIYFVSYEEGNLQINKKAVAIK